MVRARKGLRGAREASRIGMLGAWRAVPQEENGEETGVRMIVALAGGVGAAKLLRGLVDVMAPDMLTIISNTGDDIELYGLYISPDIDIVAYTLSGLSEQKRRAGACAATPLIAWPCCNAMAKPQWFHLGDRNLGFICFAAAASRHLDQALPRPSARRSVSTSVFSQMSNEPIPSLIRTPVGLFQI